MTRCSCRTAAGNADIHRVGGKAHSWSQTVPGDSPRHPLVSYSRVSPFDITNGLGSRHDPLHNLGVLMIDLDLVQWPAMVVTVAASWLVASKSERHRNLGFWVFMLSNLLWVGWGVHAGATALVVLQLCLAAMNIRGAKKTTE